MLSEVLFLVYLFCDLIVQQLITVNTEEIKPLCLPKTSFLILYQKNYLSVIQLINT